VEDEQTERKWSAANSCRKYLQVNYSKAQGDCERLRYDHSF